MARLPTNSFAGVFGVLAFSFALAISANAKDGGIITLPTLLKPPCSVIHAEELEDDWVSTSVTLADAQGGRLTCFWGENGVRVENPGGRPIRTKPGDAEEQVLLKRLREALVLIYNPAFDKTHDTIPNQLEIRDASWFTQKAVQRLVKELAFRCKYKRQPTYDEADSFDKQGQAGN